MKGTARRLYDWIIIRAWSWKCPPAWCPLQLWSTWNHGSALDCTHHIPYWWQLPFILDLIDSQQVHLVFVITLGSCLDLVAQPASSLFWLSLVYVYIPWNNSQVQYNYGVKGINNKDWWIEMHESGALASNDRHMIISGCSCTPPSPQRHIHIVLQCVGKRWHTMASYSTLKVYITLYWDRNTAHKVKHGIKNIHSIITAPPCITPLHAKFYWQKKDSKTQSIKVIETEIVWTMGYIEVKLSEL